MLDHVTLRTHDLEGTSAFFEIVLGLKPGYRPASIFPGYWLCGGGRAVVHLIPGSGGTADCTGETIDHVAYQLTDHDGLRRKLDPNAHGHSAGTRVPRRAHHKRRIRPSGRSNHPNLKEAASTNDAEYVALREPIDLSRR
jgi:catechol 2,3-dioxygenase-like lactoylglutathione lyase family enzyme